MHHQEQPRSYYEYEDENQEIETESIWHGCEEQYEQNRKDFIKWLIEKYNPSRIYYPGSGADSLPKEVFGEDKIVHVSLEGEYFAYLNRGQRVEADFIDSPFKDESFDVVFIHDTPIEVTIKGLGEFYRVLKNNGVLVLDNGDWDDQRLRNFIEKTGELFNMEQLPDKFNDSRHQLINVGERLDDHVSRVLGLVTSEEQMKKLLKNIPPNKQDVIRQFFAVFKKKIGESKNN